MTWQLLVGLGVVGASTLGLIGFAWFALGRVADAQGARAAMAVAHAAALEVERRLRKQAEKERDEALSEQVRLEAQLAGARAAGAAAMAAAEKLAADKAKETTDAIENGPLADADAAVDDLLRR